MADGTNTTTVSKGRRMRQRPSHEVNCKSAAGTIAWTFLLAILGLVAVSARQGYAEQPPPPCHPNPRAPVDMVTVANRDDVRQLPAPLKQRLVQLAGRPHSVLPVQAFNEADKP